MNRESRVKGDFLSTLWCTVLWIPSGEIPGGDTTGRNGHSAPIYRYC